MNRDRARPGEVDPVVAEHFFATGWALFPDVLSGPALVSVRDALVAAAATLEARGLPVRLEDLDPGGCNIRVPDLLAHAPAFADLAEDPFVLRHVAELLGSDLILSNFTANTALPGSGSMNAHSDQSTIMPEPWPELLALNAIWCLHDMDEENGATRYLPGSHRFTTFADVPADPKRDMVSFEAPAGSVLLMHGRLWHTSGHNRSVDRERALLFAFYSRSFLRPQRNWWQVIDGDRRRELSPTMQALLCFDSGNLDHGGYLVG